LASILGEERCIKQCLPIVEEMAKDNVFYVRKEAASAIGSLAAVVNRNVVVDKLVSIWFFCLVTYPRYHFKPVYSFINVI
jgi:hypothetical protein